MASLSAGEVSGPVARMATPSSGIEVTSPRTISTPGSASISAVTRSAKRTRSTASADPAGTRVSSATRIIS